MEEFRRQQLLDEACEALRDGASVRALATLDQLAALAPGEPAVHYLRAHALLISGGDREALTEAKRAVALAPHNLGALRVLARAAWQAQRLSMAQWAFETVIERDGGEAASLVDYAEFMACERGPKLGEQAARAALEADEQSATAWAALGIAQHRMNRRAEAEASLMRALATDSANPRAQWAMIRLLQERGQHGKADALASFLKDVPGAESFVDQVHREASRRLAVQKVFERPGSAESAVVHVQQSAHRAPRHLALAAVLVLAAALPALWWFGGQAVPFLGIALAFLALRYAYSLR